MAKEEGETKKKVEEEKAPRRKKSSIIFIILAVIVAGLGGGGYVGWKTFIEKTKEVQNVTSSSTARQNDDRWISLPLETFIVNLYDPESINKRYLKVRIELEVDNEEISKLANRRTAQIRDTIILLLSGQGISEISSIDGKLELKEALLSRIKQVLGQGSVHKIYFSEFVIQ